MGIVDELLTIKPNCGKPCYNMASEKPLALWECTYPEDQLVFGNQALSANEAFHQAYREARMESALHSGFLGCNRGADPSEDYRRGFQLERGHKLTDRHKKLSTRQKEPSLEERVANLTGDDLARYQK